MAQVTQPRRTAEFDHKANTVLAVEEIKHLVVKFSGPDGKISKAIVMCFGKLEDKGVGVFVLAGEDKMMSELTVANPFITKYVRNWLESSAKTEEERVPATQLNLLGGDEE